MIKVYKGTNLIINKKEREVMEEDEKKVQEIEGWENNT